MNLIFRYINKLEFGRYDHPVVLCLQDESPENLRSKFWDNIAPLIQGWIEHKRLAHLFDQEASRLGFTSIGSWESDEKKKAYNEFRATFPNHPSYYFKFAGEEFYIYDWYDFKTNLRTEPEIYTLDEWFDKFKVA